MKFRKANHSAIVSLIAILALAGCSDGSGPGGGADNRRIAFASDRSGDTEIWVMRADGSGMVNLTQAAGIDDEPAWSPDGSHIAFVSAQSGYRELFIMDSAGGDQLQLTHLQRDIERPTWSPDGSRLLFSIDGILHLVDPDGGDTVSIDHSGGLEAAWNPHAPRIAVSHGTCTIALVDTTGNGFVAVTRCANNSVDGDPAWNPAGSRLVYFRATNAIYSLVVSDTLGSYELNLTATVDSTQAIGVTQPAWSHDGRDIAFTCNTSLDRFQPRYDLCLIHPDGSGFRTLTHDAAADTWPAWAP